MAVLWFALGGIVVWLLCGGILLGVLHLVFRKTRGRRIFIRVGIWLLLWSAVYVGFAAAMIPEQGRIWYAVYLSPHVSLFNLLLVIFLPGSLLFMAFFMTGRSAGLQRRAHGASPGTGGRVITSGQQGVSGVAGTASIAPGVLEVRVPFAEDSALRTLLQSYRPDVHQFEEVDRDANSLAYHVYGDVRALNLLIDEFNQGAVTIWGVWWHQY